MEKTLFGKICREAFLEEFDAQLVSAGDISVRCPRSYYRTMSRIIGQPVGRELCMIKRMLTAILIAILMLVACASAVYKEEIEEFLISVRDECIEVTPIDDIGTGRPEIEKRYMIEYIPEGYSICDKGHLSCQSSYKWENANGEYICFRQFSKWDSYSFDFKDMRTLEGIATDFEACYYRSDPNSFWFWKHDGYYCMIQSETVFPDEEILKMIQSLKAVN